MFDRSKRPKKPDLQEERQIYSEIEQKSDWIYAIRELKRSDVVTMLRNPTNPTMRYLLFMDGVFEGEYNTNKRLSTVTMSAGNYLVYEVRNERKRIEFDFPEAPVADAPEKSTKVHITIQIAITEPQELIMKGILNIHDMMRIRMDAIVRDISSRYKGEANRECEADLKRNVEVQVFESNIEIIDVTVQRDVPLWVGAQRNERIERQRKADEDKQRAVEEKEKRQLEQRLAMQRQRLEIERLREQRDDEQHNRLEAREDIEDKRLQRQRDEDLAGLEAELQAAKQKLEELNEVRRKLAEGLDTDKMSSPVSFRAYYPRQVAAKTEYGFYIYAHLPDALIETDIQAFSAELGGRVPKAVVAEKNATLQEGALLTVMIHSDKLKFNQMGAMQVWKAPFVRFDFKFTADESLIDEIVEGRVAILLGMIEIASIDFKISIGAASPLVATNTLPEDPRLSLPASDTVPPYQKIFISYSRKDTIVAEQYRAAQTMLGNTIFMDVHTIRAGEDWNDALKRFIAEADVFQLFWSEHSAASENVRFEWEYALKQRCPDTLCRQFIRPTYWQKPMPPVPTELNHLHFAHVEVTLPESKTGDSA
jgi:hypothetical protein